MNAFKHFLAIFSLSLSVFAPQAKAMSGRARQVAAMVAKSPNITAALTQAGKTGAKELSSAIAPQAERRLLTNIAPSRLAINQISHLTKPSNGLALAGSANAMPTPIASRSFNTSASQSSMLHYVYDWVMGPQTEAFKLKKALMQNPSDVVGIIIKNKEKITRLMNDSESVKELMPYIGQNLAALVKDFEGLVFLNRLVNNNPESAKELMPYAVQNFAVLVKDHDGLVFLERLVDNNPESAKELMPYAVQNFAALVNDWCGLEFLNGLMKDNPESAKKLMPYIGQNIAALVKDWNGRKFLNGLMENSPESAKELMPYIGQNLAALVKDFEGLIFLNRLVRNNSKSANELMSYIGHNIAALVKDRNGRIFLNDLMENNTESAKKLARFAGDNLAALVTSGDGVSFLKSLMDKNPEVREMVRRDHQNNNNIFLKALVSNQPTITQKYLVDTYEDMHHIARNDLMNGEVAGLIDETVAFEKGLGNPYYMFEHGRRWAYKLPEMVYRHFYQIANNVKLPNDFMFTHTKPHIYSPKLKEAEYEQEKRLHQQVINEHANIAGEVRNRRLFMNTGLLGNVNSQGSNSLYYVLKNYNQADARVSIQSIFKQFGLQALYQKHKTKCEELEKEAQVLSKWGQLLAIGIPKAQISNLATYLCITGRPKSAINVRGQETYDVKKILDARLEDPALANNRINWVAAMTDNALLDPRSGVKIKAIERPLDPAQFKAWEMKFNEFMHSISAEAKEIMDAHKKAAIEKDSQTK